LRTAILFNKKYQYECERALDKKWVRFLLGDRPKKEQTGTAHNNRIIIDALQTKFLTYRVIITLNNNK